MTTTLRESLTRAMQSVILCRRHFGNNSKEYDWAARTFQRLVQKSIQR